MTDKQPEALRLADILDSYIMVSMDGYKSKASKELRRLQAENERLKTVPMKYRRMEFNAQLQTENDRLRAQRDELLDALKRLMASDDAIEQATDDCLRFAINDQSADLAVREQAAAVLQARSAIAKAEGEKSG